MLYFYSHWICVFLCIKQFFLFYHFYYICIFVNYFFFHYGSSFVTSLCSKIYRWLWSSFSLDLNIKTIVDYFGSLIFFTEFYSIFGKELFADWLDSLKIFFLLSFITVDLKYPFLYKLNYSWGVILLNSLLNTSNSKFSTMFDKILQVAQLFASCETGSNYSPWKEIIGRHHRISLECI